MKSSWIQSISYKRLDDGSSYLALFLKDEEKYCPSCKGRGCGRCYGTGYVRIPAALLYGGPDSPIPSWLSGLVQAGTGGKSVGHAYHKLVKGKYPSQRVEGRKKVEELRRMLS